MSPFNLADLFSPRIWSSLVFTHFLLKVLDWTSWARQCIPMLQARATFSRAWSPGWHWPQNVCLDLSQSVTDATASTISLVKLIANLALSTNFDFQRFSSSWCWCIFLLLKAPWQDSDSGSHLTYGRLVLMTHGVSRDPATLKSHPWGSSSYPFNELMLCFAFSCLCGYNCDCTNVI